MTLVLRYRGSGGIRSTVSTAGGGFIPQNPPDILVPDPKIIQQHIRNSAGTADLHVPTTSRRRGTQELPFTLLEISLSAQNLLDRDVLSKSDPACIIYVKDINGRWLEVGRTERVINSLNPIWNTKFVLKYRFQTKQLLQFEIYDWDERTSDLSAHDYLGAIKCSLGEIVSAPNQKFVRDLILPAGFRGNSTLTIIAEELSDDDLTILRFRISCRKLDKKKFFGDNNPFLTISKRIGDGSWVLIHKTEIVKGTSNPVWRFFTVRITAFKSGDNFEVPLRFRVMDWNRSGFTELIGEFFTNYVDLAKRVAEEKSTFELINNSKAVKKKSKYKNSGELTIHSMNIEQEMSFMDHLKNGLELNCTIAIDFSVSTSSLHYYTSDGKEEWKSQCGKVYNYYTVAIEAIGEILEDYNHSREIPAFGFGAILPPSLSLSQDFPLNGNASNPLCDGVKGILEAYHHALNSVELSFPSKMSPIIRNIARSAKLHKDGKHYHILVIITRGKISDSDETTQAIIKASKLPMSIIIIGVGELGYCSVDFLKTLDGDGHLLQSYGTKAVRDVVQFVEMQKFMPSELRKLTDEEKLKLSSAVLAELPEQVCSWMKEFKLESPSSPSASTSSYPLPT